MKKLFFLLFTLAAFAMQAQTNTAPPAPQYQVGIGPDGKAMVVETVTNAISTSSAELNRQIGELDKQLAKLAEQRKLLADLLPLVISAEAEAAKPKPTPTDPPKQ